MLMNLSCKAYSKVACFFADKRGVTAIEYAIIAVAISAMLLTAVGSDGFIGKLETAFSTIATKISSAG